MRKCDVLVQHVYLPVAKTPDELRPCEVAVRLDAALNAMAVLLCPAVMLGVRSPVSAPPALSAATLSLIKPTPAVPAWPKVMDRERMRPTGTPGREVKDAPVS